MKGLKNISLILTVLLCGCSASRREIAVYNGFRNDTVAVEFIYGKDFLPQDSTVKYLNGYLFMPLQQFSEHELSLYEVPTELSQRINLRLPDYEYGIEFKGNKMTYFVPPRKTAMVEIRRRNLGKIAGMIERITIKAGSDSVVCSTPEEVASMLRKSKYYNGIKLCVDSTIIRR